MRIVAIGVLSLLLTGCVPSDPVVTPVPAPTSTPLFATDADALKAAEDAYAAYLKVSDQILRDGGENPDRILTVATQSVARRDEKGFAEFVSKGYHGVGQTSFDATSLERYSPGVRSGAVAIYTCVDISHTDVVDSSGESVVNANRDVLTPFEVTFDIAVKRSILIVSAESVWTGADFCK